jgi:hypothetical protein
MVDRQAERHTCEILSRQGKGSAVRYRSGIPSEPCYREGMGEGEGEMTGPSPRDSHWTSDEDQRLLKLVEAIRRLVEVGLKTKSK